MPDAKTVSLILGSGGARGLAHIGVVAELEERGYKIRSIVGCSMGALIGGLYAAGKLPAFETWVTNLSQWDVIRFLDISLTNRTGMMKGDLIMNELRAMVGERRVEELPIRFTAVATDVANKKEIWLSRGDLFDVIRASISIPGVFTPKEIDGIALVDGGLLNPLPVAPATDHRTDLTIAVNLNGREVAQPLGPNPPPPPADSLESYRSRIDGFVAALQDKLGIEPSPETPAQRAMHLTDVLLGMFDTMQAAIARYRLASYPPDILIDIPDNVCETHEFHKAAQLIAAGRYWAGEYLNRQADPR